MNRRTAPEGAVRTLVVWCLDWPVVAAGVAPDVPAVVVRANRVVAATAAARAEGVAVGLRRREAQRRCPGLAVLADDPARDARAFEPVLAALDALTPRLEAGCPGWCSFPTRGPSRYLGGDEAMAARAVAVVASVLDGRGPCRVGVADGAFAAGLAARRAVGPGRPSTVVPPGGSAAFLAELPLDALDRPELVGLLGRLGLRTLGDLAALPVAAVTARFGAEGAVVHRLAWGADPHVADLRPPPLDLAVAVQLDPPVDRVDTAAFAARGLAERFHGGLAERGLACLRVRIEAETEHGEHLGRCWRHEGLLSAAAVADRVRWQLDGWLAGPTVARPTGGLTLLRLVPDQVVADRGHQLGFWGGATSADERAARGLARLQGLFGPDAVLVPEPRGGRGPAEQVVAVPLVPTALLAREVPPPGRTTPAAEAPWPGRLPPPSPATVHPQPVEAEVVTVDGAPVGVTGRGVATGAPGRIAVAGRAWQDVVAWAGPWPLDERWWDPALHRRRARFQVVTADGVARLLVLEQGRWNVEATYD